MLKQVIKRDGSREPFDGEKLRRSVEVASISAGIQMDKTKEIADRIFGLILEAVADREEISTAELGKNVFSEMSKIEPGAAEIWKKHEEEKINSQNNPFISRGNHFR